MVFKIEKSQVENRWDPHFHAPRFKELERILDELKAQPLQRLSTKIFSGITPLSGGDSYTADSVNGVAFVRSGDFNDDGTIDDDRLIFLTPDVHERLMRRSQLLQGDVLFAIVGATIGKVGIFPGGYSANINQAVCGVRTASILNPHFVHAFFLTRLGQEQIERVKRPVARANMNLEEVGSLRIPLLSQQKQSDVVELMKCAFSRKKETEEEAVRILQDIDSLLLNELGIPLKPHSSSELKDRIFRGTFSAVSGRRLDPFRYQAQQQSLRTTAGQSKFEVRTLRACITGYVSGEWGSDDSESFETDTFERCLVLRNTEFDQHFNLRIESGREKYRLVQKRKLQSLHLQPGDILVEKSGGSPDQPVGRVAILTPDILGVGPMCFSNFLVKLKPDPEIVLPSFLYHWLSCAHRVGISASMQSQTNGIRNLIMEEYLSQQIPIPPPDIQTKLVTELTKNILKARQLRAQAKIELKEAMLEIETLILKAGGAT